MIGQLDLNRSLRLYCITSDGGADQIKCRRIIKSVSRWSLCDIIVDFGCAQHACQLVIKSGLVEIDRWAAAHGLGWKYYSSVAKFQHTWRDNARAYFQKWAALFGDVSAAQSVTSRMPPKCVPGRWGSITAVQKAIIKGQRHCLGRVAVEVCSGRTWKPVPDPSGAPPLADGADAAPAGPTLGAKANPTRFVRFLTIARGRGPLGPPFVLWRFSKLRSHIPRPREPQFN